MPRETAEERKIVDEAHKRFKRCQEYESTARQRYLDDVKFAEGDSENRYQWDSAVWNSRTADVNGARPCLTINKTRQHCLQIVNDARQNKASVEVRPTGDGATYEAAKVFEGIVRHIEYQSKATEAYEAATWHQVTGGWGYWRVLTQYADENSFDQELYIKRIANPLNVYLDPDISEFDGSDARFGFVFDDVPRDKFEVEYPQWKDEVCGTAPLAGDAGDWSNKDHVRVAEYYRITETADTLYALNDEKGSLLLRSEIPADLREAFDAVKAEKVRAERPTIRKQLEWFKIAGSRIISSQSERKQLGRYIPIVRVIGEETTIPGEHMDRKGHARALKDPQRMYNYWSSSATEYVALQGKSPFIAPAQAIEGHEQAWNNANRENKSVLPYNHVDDDGREIPAPSRSQAPVASTAYMQGMATAQNELMLASGQYQADMGAPSNERSGVAILQRQRQGDNATYHYIDHLAQAIRYTGRILIDLIPQVYDTPRITKIMGEDGSQTDIRVDPSFDKPYAKMVGGQPVSDEQFKAAQADPDLKDRVAIIFNPNVGKYAVQADIGPSYGTKRQEAVAAMTDIMARNADIGKIAGDILFKNMDFAGADEVAERIKRAIPPQILGEGEAPELQQAKQQIQEMGMALQALQAELEEKGKKHDLEDYKAETARMQAAASIDPEAFKPVIRQLVAEMLNMGLDEHAGLMAAHAEADQARQPLPAQGETAPVQ